ncbi:hypothetical protein ACSBQT_05645 [Brevibacterium sp. H602]
MHAITLDTIRLAIGAVIPAVATKGFRTQFSEFTVDSIDSEQQDAMARA